MIPPSYRYYFKQLIPERIYSYSRSLRHFGEIRAKKGDMAVNDKAYELYIKASSISNQPI